MPESQQESFYEQVSPLAPDSTLGILTSKLHYLHNGRYYTTGGFTDYVEGLAEHFKKTILVVPVARTNNPANLRKISCEKYRIHPLSAWVEREFNAGLAWPYIRRQVRIAFADCDIVNVRMYSMHSLVALSAIEKTNKPVFFSLTGQQRQRPPQEPWFKTIPKSIIVRWMESALRRHLTFVHGPYLVEVHNLNPELCLPTYSSTYHNTDIMNEPINAPESAGHIRMFFVGRLNMEKGVDILLKAMAAEADISKRFQLHVVGDGSARPFLENLAKSLELQNIVTFHGYVPHGPEWEKLMKSAHVLAFVPLHEGAPKVVTEALRFGLPILASKVGAIPTILRENTNGWLVEPGDINQVVDALKCILKMDKNMWQTISKANLKLAGSYTIEEVSRDMVQSLIEHNLLPGR